MDQFTLFMERINTYIESPFGMFTVCTAPIMGYFVYKIYIRPLLERKDKAGEE